MEINHLKALSIQKYSYKPQVAHKWINKNQYKYIVMGGVSSNPSNIYLAHITKNSHNIDKIK